jgi:hypothetical protein
MIFDTGFHFVVTQELRGKTSGFFLGESERFIKAGRVQHTDNGYGDAAGFQFACDPVGDVAAARIAKKDVGAGGTGLNNEIGVVGNGRQLLREVKGVEGKIREGLASCEYPRASAVPGGKAKTGGRSFVGLRQVNNSSIALIPN